MPDYFHPSIILNSHLFALSLDAKLLFTGGHWDSSLQVYSISKNKVVSSVISHFGELFQNFVFLFELLKLRIN